MKRLVGTITCLFVLFAGTASAWSLCKQISFEADDHRDAPVSHPVHDHDSDSHHKNSDGAQVHCPIFKDFVPTAVNSAKPNFESQRVADSFVGELVSFAGYREFCHPILGPPALAQSSGVPYHIFLSLRRI